MKVIICNHQIKFFFILVARSVLRANPQRKQEAAMSMYFYDETDDWPEYQIIKDEIRRLEKEYLEIRKELIEVEPAFGSDPEDKDLRTKVEGLKKTLKEIQDKLEKSSSLYR